MSVDFIKNNVGILSYRRYKKIVKSVYKEQQNSSLILGNINIDIVYKPTYQRFTGCMFNRDNVLVNVWDTSTGEVYLCDYTLFNNRHNIRSLYELIKEVMNRDDL